MIRFIGCESSHPRFHDAEAYGYPAPRYGFRSYRFSSSEPGGLSGCNCRRNNPQDIPAVAVAGSGSAGSYDTVETGFVTRRNAL